MRCYRKTVRPNAIRVRRLMRLLTLRWGRHTVTGKGFLLDRNA
jgi:hypothetical protein